jgi:hypothetical protein
MKMWAAQYSHILTPRNIVVLQRLFVGNPACRFASCEPPSVSYYHCCGVSRKPTYTVALEEDPCRGIVTVIKGEKHGSSYCSHLVCSS